MATPHPPPAASGGNYDGHTHRESEEVHIPLFVRRVMPDATEAELVAATQNLLDYMKAVLQIAARLENDRTLEPLLEYYRQRTKEYEEKQYQISHLLVLLLVRAKSLR